MTTPVYWRRHTFGVAETADMIGASEVALRTWIARNPMNDFNGAKTNGRLWLSGCDGFYYRLVFVLSSFGVPVRTSMYAAAQIASDAYDGKPDFKYLTVTVDDGTTNLHHTDAPTVSNAAALILPLRDLYDQHLALCAEANARDAS